MKKNGFTLAELLGVIVIMAAIALVAFPPIINQIKNSRKDLDDALNSILSAAADQYLEENNYNTKSSSYCIQLNVLVRDGKLSEPVIDSKGEIVNLSSIFYVRYEDGKRKTSGLYSNNNEIKELDNECTSIGNNNAINE